MISDRTTVVTVLLAGMVLLTSVAVVLLLRLAASRALIARVHTATGIAPTEPGVAQNARSGGMLGILRRLGEWMRGSKRLYSQADLAAIEGLLMASGFKAKQVLPIALGAKAGFLILAVLGAILYGLAENLPVAQRILAVALALPVGLIAPEIVMRMLRRPYVNAVRRGVADALDLLVVCTEAGMGLESALQEVAREIRYSNPAIAATLTTLLDELRVLPDRREAFQNFGRRSGVEGIRRMATILGQTLQYGTPLGQSLRAMANELRREHIVRMEAKAVRLPALLVFPLIGFILPALFVALMGPTMLRLLDLLHSAGGGHMGR